MKLILSAILFCGLFAQAADTNITSKVSEKRDNEGKVIRRIETLYRGKTKILMTLSRTNKQGNLVTESRSYLVAGKSVMIEADEDKDGFFESIMVSDPATDEIELFTRQSNGSVKPADAKVIEATKKQIAATDEFFDEVFEKDMSNKELSDSILKTQKRIKDLEQEKKSDKK
jgi:hypothetical protein